MNYSEIAWHRSYQQGLTQPRCSTPAAVIAWNGAVQSQDYAGAKWAVAQRTQGFVAESALDQAFDEGNILRTHAMRPTWHFVTPRDIRWLLALTAPRVHAANAYYYRKLEIDGATMLQSNAAIVKALEGGKHLTRAELATAINEAGIPARDLRLTFLIMIAELDAVICSGSRRGKQFTYALLEERVPPVPQLEPDEALAELTKRYFTSHGPALLHDFVWWSGLTVTAAKQGIELVKSDVAATTVNDKTYWSSISPAPRMGATSIGNLLPNYDEAVAGYTDYSASTAPQFADTWVRDDRVYSHYLVINGLLVGTWKRKLLQHSVMIDCKLFANLSSNDRSAISTAADNFGKFLGREVELNTSLTASVG